MKQIIDNTLPNFLVVGAAKCGTTSIYRLLSQHPSVYFPVLKEPRFFDSEMYKTLSQNDPRHDQLVRETVFSLKQYKSLYADSQRFASRGDATATYLYNYRISIPRIKECLGDEVKIIIIIRNPVERACSAYRHLYMEGWEDRSFTECLLLEEQRKRENWSTLNLYRNSSNYYQQVSAFLESFNSVRVYMFEDFIINPQKTMDSITDFLDLSRLDFDTRIRYNISGKPISKSAYNGIVKLQKSIEGRVLAKSNRDLSGKVTRAFELGKQILMKDEKIDCSPSDGFRESFIGDISSLEKLLNIDCTRWSN